MKKIIMIVGMMFSAIAVQAKSLYTIINPVVERKTVI